MQVVCLQEEAFFALFDKVVEHVDAKRKDKPDKWIDGNEAIRELRINPLLLYRNLGMKER